MTNEWEEYLAYTLPPKYECKSKNDSSYLGRFTTKMIYETVGFTRIFTILARGFLFHNPDGTLKSGDPYSRADEARQMLCAWCSVPDNKKATREEWQYTSDFRELYDRFPNLVGEDGYGWYARHIHNSAEFIRENAKTVRKTSLTLVEKIGGFDAMWRDKVIHYLVPIFCKTTEGEFFLRFDDCIADALEQGPLRTEKYELTAEQKAWTDEIIGSVVPKNVAYTLFEYYLANKTDESEWVILPQVNFDAYFGNMKFSKTQLVSLPGEFIERRLNNNGVSMYRINMPNNL